MPNVASILKVFFLDYIFRHILYISSLNTERFDMLYTKLLKTNKNIIFFYKYYFLGICM